MKFEILLLSSVWLLYTNHVEASVSVDGKLTITDKYDTGNCKLTVQEGDLVTWKSYGYLLNGVNFDIGVYEGKIGNNEAPKGIDQGLIGLCYGDWRSLKISADWAYGEDGLNSKNVGPNQTVIYDVTILSIERTVQERKGLLMNEILKIVDTNVVENCGMKVQSGDKIHWHYIGTFTDGSGFDTGDYTARIDKGEIIHGVNEAMKNLCVGGRRIMKMHHSYAYGDKGTGNIPPHANLVFDVYLKSIDRPGVGWEDIDSKGRKATVVTKHDPVKTHDINVTENCADKVTEGDFVTWMRHGSLLNGKIFEEIQVETRIGEGQGILATLEKGLVGLCAGDNRSITLYPDVAYGAKGLPGRVPMNAYVIFDVTIIDVAEVSTKVDL